MDSKIERDAFSLKPLLPDSWPDESMYFGLTIQVSDPTDHQLHAAALYRFGGHLMIGDVQNHLVSRRSTARASGGVFWIRPDLGEEDQRILAATIDAWLDKNAGKIPYSVAHPGGVVFRDDVWVGYEPGQGMTCSTFIVELFNELGIPFIDVSTWEKRVGDDEWARRILATLSHLMEPSHVRAQVERIGDSIRVRPADVAAAGLLVYREMVQPLRFEDVAERSAQIETLLLPT